jgi:hypothetical protein
MLDMVKKIQCWNQTEIKKAIRYATTMANISIKNNKSPHERFLEHLHQ